MASLQGYDQLQRRLKAISPQAGVMKLYGTAVVGELKRNIPRKTSGTSRTIHLASATATSARVEGNAVAKWLDVGTGIYGPHKKKITPKVKKALAFYAGPAGSMRLTGRPRSGAAGAGASKVVVRSVKGMKAQPYVDRSIDAVERKIGVDLIVKRWNEAA